MPFGAPVPHHAVIPAQHGILPIPVTRNDHPDEQIISFLPAGPGTLDTSKPTAGKAIALLQKNDVLPEMGSRKRDRIYCYSSYLDILTN